MEPVTPRLRSQILRSAWAAALLGLVTSGVACGSNADNPPNTFTVAGQGGEGASGSSGTAGSGVPTGGTSGAFNLDAGSAGGTSGDGGDLDAACAAEVAQGEVIEVTMLVMFDKSGSMDDPVDNTTRWALASAALNAFFQDPGSAGLNVALRFFPDDVPAAGCNHRDCNANACSQVRVPIGTLLADPAPADAHEGALVSAVNATTPGGNTPTYAALAGAELWATAYQAANPAVRTVVIFVTDGEPNGCNEDPSAIAGLAENARTSGGVLTYAIGVSQNVGRDVLDPIAVAGGTNQAILVGDGNAQTELLRQLQNIRGAIMSCSFGVPASRDPSKPVDLTKVNVNYTPGGTGMPQLIGGVASAADCGPNGGWYYDNPAAPTQIILCPATCTTVQADKAAQVSILMGCRPTVPPPPV